MKRTLVILLLLLAIAAPTHAFNWVDKMVYRKSVLKANRTPILVNRFTGEVGYIWRADGKWIELTGQWKDQYQKMYNAQSGHK